MKKFYGVFPLIFITLVSCDQTSSNMYERPVDSIKTVITNLRKHGFFEKYAGLGDIQLFDTLHKRRIAGYTEMFERHYDPGMDLQDHEILSLDEDRTIGGDAEADVGKDNNCYVQLLQTASRASGGLFSPENIVEDWKTEHGPITVSFTNRRDTIQFHPEYHEDWLDIEVFHIINQQMAKAGKEKFYLFLNKDGNGLGQYYLYIRMSEAQGDAITKTFGWQFAE